MSLSKKGFLTNDTKLNLPSKATTLNPNAAEFVPFTLRSSSSPSGSTSNTADGATKFTTGTVGRAVLDRSESSVSNASDDEAHQFWRHQLPDDITPDFKVMSEDESQGLGGLSLAGLSLHDSEVHRFNASSRSGYLLLMGKIPSSASFLNLPTKPWDKQIANSDHLLGNGREFPGFATESLAEVYFANGCDLNLTIEMLTQLEGRARSLKILMTQSDYGLMCNLKLQVDGSFNQNTNTKTLSAPSLSALDFPALTVLDNQNDSSKYNGDDLQQASIPYRSSNKDNMLLFKPGGSFSSRGAVDFASAVRKLASQDSSMWKHVRNGSADSTVGSSRSSHVLPSAYGGGHGRSIYADRQSRGSGRQAPVWLETGEAVANMYSEMREEARDHARLRNVYFEQARQAYLIGNKALAKELSAKGQLHNMHMKEAHGKAQESIYHQRNPASLEMQGAGRGHEQMIDLHGLHVTEAIHVLKQELSVLRSTARAADQRLQVYICVGTGHHTRGSRTPARLPVAVQRYLLEEEGLDYTEPHPGLLRVVIY
ncbi:hypothetical protein OIU84_010176 [Salix udensis]|uniref:Smr domain-containing protein n=1 Tax=Salix udensis TaxID=889485 RepID=A0AAD6JK48_9ROSI|nr:hypothetical protein OIU84_010176 [Salix udensis]